MKKIIIGIFLVLTLILFSRDDTSNNTSKVLEANSLKEEKRGLFFSYIELEKYVKDSNFSKMKKNIDNVISNVKKMNFNLLVLQVRSASDAIYESSIFPWSNSISQEEGVKSIDVLAYFLQVAHKEGIDVYAWVNPYRVRTNDDVSSISEKNPAYKYIGTDTLYVGGGIYYNPSKKEVVDLIVEGVREIVDNYEVDGVIFDDYFYPNNEIDIKDYENYLLTNENISKTEYNLMIVSNMVEKVHEVCKGKNVLFGVSPEGNINNNYEKNFADVKLWLKSDLYIDFIMPQIYYGFFNETQSFPKVLEEWSNLIANKNIKMLVALAFYKVGRFDEYAKSGGNEWLNNDNIIMKEIISSRNIKQYEGFCLFRYGFLFDESLYSNTSLQEINNMQKILK